MGQPKIIGYISGGAGVGDSYVLLEMSRDFLLSRTFNLKTPSCAVSTSRTQRRGTEILPPGLISMRLFCEGNGAFLREESRELQALCLAVSISQALLLHLTGTEFLYFCV